MSLDEVDLMIIDELKNDARQPVRALARKLGLNRETVRYRLNRMISDGTLSIVCASNVERLGYQFLMLIGVKVRPGKIDAVANQLADLPSVRAVSLTTSRYNILAWGLFRDRPALAHFISEDMAKISDITSTEIMHSFHWIKDFWMTLDPLEQNFDSYPQDYLSDLDLDLIEAMQADPTQTMSELARTISCSRAVAKRRFERLVNDGIIAFLSLVDPTMMGYEYWVAILVKTELDKVNVVGNKLSAQDMTMHVTLITGQWQLFVIALFQDSAHLHDFISGALGAISGIIEFEVVPLGKTVKFSTGVINAI